MKEQTNVKCWAQQGDQPRAGGLGRGRSLDLERGKKLGEEWGMEGRIRVPGKGTACTKALRQY